MDERQQMLANMSYMEEQEEQVDMNVLRLRKLGLDDANIQEGYNNYAVRQTPTFVTSPQNNKSLSDLLSVAEVMKNPELQESEAYSDLYNEYLSYRMEQSYRESGFILKSASNLSRVIKGGGGGMIQTGDSRFNIPYNELDQDSKKAIDWLNTLNSNKNPEKEGTLKTFDTLTKIAGVFADGSIIQAKLGGSARTVGKAIMTKTVEEADSVIGKAVATAFIKRAPEDVTKLSKAFLSTGQISYSLAEGVATGLAFSLRDIATNENLKDMETGDKFKQLSKEFGLGMAIDAAVGVTGALVVPLLKNHARILVNPTAGNFSKGTIKSTDDAVALAVKALKGEVDPNTLKKIRQAGDGEVADILAEVQGESIKIKTFKDMGLDEDASMVMLALGSNMKVNKLKTGYEVTLDTLAKKPKVKTVATLNDVASLVEAKHVKGLKKLSNVEIARSASQSKELKIQQVWEATKKSPSAKIELEAFSDAILPKSGAFNAKTKAGALSFSKAAIKNLGDGVQEGLENLDVKLANNFFKNLPDVTSDTMMLPRLISNGTEFRQYTKYVGDFISAHGTNINKVELDSVLKKLGDATGTWSFSDMNWIDAQAKKAGYAIKKADGAYYLDDGVQTLTFESEDLLGNYLNSDLMTPESYNEFLKVTKDFSLIPDTDLGGFTVLNQAKAKIAHGDTIAEITGANSLLRPKYPLDTAPRLGIVNDSLDQIVVYGDHIEGSVDQINKYIHNYSDNKVMSDIFNSKEKMYVKPNSGSKVLFNVNKKKWIVTADNFGMRPQQFSSEKSLQKFLDTIGTPEKTLQKVGGQKGVQVLANRAGYVVYKAGETAQTFKNFADTTNYVKNLPNKAITPEAVEKAEYLVSLNQNLYGAAVDNVDLNNFAKDSRLATLQKTWDDAHLEKIESAGKKRLDENLRNIFNKFTPNRARVYSMVKGNADRIPLAKAFDNILEAEKNMKVMHNRTNIALNKINKIVPEKRRVELGQLLSKEMPEADWASNFNKLTGDTLTAKDTEYLKATRTLYDQAGALNGFGDTLDSIENYFTKLKTLSLDDLLDTSTKTNTIGLVEKAYGRKLYPAESKFYEKMRKVDLAGYAVQQDPSKLLDRYISDTLKKTYLEPAITKLETMGKNLLEDGEELDAITTMVESARGLTQDSTIESLKAMTDKIAVSAYKKTASGYIKAHKVGKDTNQYKAFMQGKVSELSSESIANMSVEEQQIFAQAMSKHNFRSNPINKLFGLTTLSLQAGKGWLPIRNTFQPETHLAPIFGIDSVIKAKEDVSKLSREGYMMLADKGIFQTSSIQSQLGIAGDGFIEKLNNAGLAHFKGSDDFDRAVGFMAVRNAMIEGLEGSTAWGDKSGTFFSQQSKLYAAPKHIRDSVLQSIAKNDLDSAVTSYAQWINDMTFLNYSSLNKPEAFTSFKGKVFGQMGTFATQTLASRKYFVENLTAVDKAFYVGRAVLAGVALNSAFSELTGNEVNSFSSINSMKFMGGPIVDLTIAGRDMMSSSEYKQKQGRSAVKRSFSTLLSPAHTISNIAGGAAQIVGGDPFYGAQKLLNFPGGGEPAEDDLTYADYLRRL